MDFSTPTLTTGYADFVAAVKARDEDIAKMFDGTTTTNLPNGAKRWNATGKKFEKFDGTSWSDLTTLYEIKVADSNKLNGQLSTYYATADHNHNTLYAALLHTHDYSPSTHNHDSTYLGKTATAADSSKIGGYLPHLSAFGNTAAIRDANGDLTARYFKGSVEGLDLKYLVPSGGIIMWSGSTASIPTGWVLCNGLNGTPNLQDRFIVGAGATYAVGATGGSKDAVIVSHSHSGSTDSTGAHAHSTAFYSYAQGGINSPSYAATNNGSIGSLPTSSAGAHSHTVSVSSTGESGTNKNLPPYYALAFIMKT
jgi:hypothetical protein